MNIPYVKKGISQRRKDISKELLGSIILFHQHEKKFTKNTPGFTKSLFHKIFNEN